MDQTSLIATVTANSKAENDIGEPVFCALFDAQSEYADNFRVTIPGSAEVLLL